jgi:hypothetical protein
VLLVRIEVRRLSDPGVKQESRRLDHLRQG